MLADIAKQIAQDISNKLNAAEQAPFQAPFNSAQLQALLQSALRKCQLVTREEFDAQSLVLARTRTKVEALEQQMLSVDKQLSALEKELSRHATAVSQPNINPAAPQ
ncbi:MAG: accessory factor UbiK family protein [Marinagarivorans sp.]|nr:accessory factor UbiK family protein [Marinagarivorans sp.]